MGHKLKITKFVNNSHERKSFTLLSQVLYENYLPLLKLTDRRTNGWIFNRKYIELNKGISIMYKFMLMQILTFITLQYNKIDREHVHIFIAKGITKKVNLVVQAKGYKQHK